MTQRIPEDAAFPGEAEQSNAERSRVALAGESTLALVYLVSFAAIAVCGFGGPLSSTAVACAGTLVGIAVCIVAAARGQILTSLLLMAVLMGLLVLKDPGAVVEVSDQLVPDSGGPLSGGSR